MTRFENKLDRADMNLACGNVAEEIEAQNMAEDAVGGDESWDLGDTGGACSLSNECQKICGIVHYSQWGSWCD